MSVRASDQATLDGFLVSGDSVESPEQAIELLCILRAEVGESGVTRFPDTSSDCFCGKFERSVRSMDRSHEDFVRTYWRNSGDELRFIIRTVREALAKAKA